MSAYFVFLLLLAGSAAGFAVAWLMRVPEITALRGDIRRLDAAHIEAASRGDSLLCELQAERVAHAAAAAERNAEDRIQQRELAAMAALRGDIETKLQAVAAEALRGSQQSFLSLAAEVFDKHRQAATTLLGEKEKSIEALLAPINASLQEYRKGLGEIEKAREAAYGGLTAHLQDVARAQSDVSRETRKLVTALQAAPKTRGRWGEQQLQNVLELSGMTPFIDFEAEKTIDRDDTRLRPDIIIRMPGDRRIIVDAKTSMAAYLDAVEATEEPERQACLDRHARQLRTHMKQLAAKAYWDALPFTPDFVVMFIPGENFFAAAIERDPQLFEDAIAGRVLIVTPTTLIALAKAIAFGWRQEKVAENARKVAELGRDLYRRLASMGGHVVALGKGLDGAIRHYNGFVGSLEGRVMPQARKFNELEVDGTSDALPDLKLVDIDARLLRTDGEFLASSASVISLTAGRLEAAEKIP
ncbi:MAG TPA: DNA recombination protein RmuC [Stellaceae bacterium]|jgi:DNA recombination protein RmuC|nr:DNA recombination protein RmuC [Stellaceae bacterium]